MTASDFPQGDAGVRLASAINAAGTIQTPKTLPGNMTPTGYQQITSLSTVQVLTVPSGSQLALLQSETQNVRWRDDGTAPGTTVGMLLATGIPLLYNGDLSALKFKETTASGVLNVSYYK